jgi:hypothetical protein
MLYLTAAMLLLWAYLLWFLRRQEERIRNEYRRPQYLSACSRFTESVKRRDAVTPSKSIKSDTCGADRRWDPGRITQRPNTWPHRPMLQT